MERPCTSTQARNKGVGTTLLLLFKGSKLWTAHPPGIEEHTTKQARGSSGLSSHHEVQPATAIEVDDLGQLSHLIAAAFVHEDQPHPFHQSLGAGFADLCSPTIPKYAGER